MRLTPNAKEKKIISILKELAEELKGSNAWIFCDGEMHVMRKTEDGKKASLAYEHAERNDPAYCVATIQMDCDGGAW